MRCIILVILSFLLTGCISSIIDSNIDNGLQTHMALAEEKEKSLNYQGAIEEYAGIFKRYDNIRSQKKAAFKVAQLNVHPNNPNIDYRAALGWLEIYSNLKLTRDEEESALVLAVLIRQIDLLKNEKDKLGAHIQKQGKENEVLLKEVTAHEAKIASMEKKLTASGSELASLEEELSKIKEKFQKIKEIDVQMHKNRKSNAETPPE